MAEHLAFELVTPERLLMERAVAHVVVPGSEGDFGVLPGHAPVMSALRPGILEIYEEETSAPKRLFVKGGFAEAGPTRLVVLAEDALDPAGVDVVDLDRRIRNAEEDLADAKDALERRRAEQALRWMRPLRGLIGG